MSPLVKKAKGGTIFALLLLLEFVNFFSEIFLDYHAGFFKKLFADRIHPQPLIIFVTSAGLQ